MNTIFNLKSTITTFSDLVNYQVKYSKRNLSQLTKSILLLFFALLLSANCFGAIITWTNDNPTNGGEDGLSGNPAKCDIGREPGTLEINNSTSLELDGVDDGIEICGSGSSFNLYPLTIEAWIKTSKVYASGSSNNVAGGIIADKYHPSSGNGWSFYVANGGILHAWYFSPQGDIYAAVGTTHVNDGNWHHVAFVVDIAGGDIYLDGNLEVSKPWNGVPSACTNSTKIARIGHGYKGSLGMYGDFDGLLDEVRIWNTVRTVGDLNTFMNTELSGTESGLVGYYKFDDVTELAGDCSGYNNYGTLMGQAQDNVDSPILTDIACAATGLGIPEINLQGKGQDITDGDNSASPNDDTDFDVVCIGNIETHSFTIQNTGTGNLVIPFGGMTISGTGANQFSFGTVTLPLIIVPGSSEIFDINFSPTSAGLKSATINIGNNDCDEDPYNFLVKGTGPAICCTDDDGDGYNDISCGGTDCNDSDASIYPGATEVCDGIDNDCDGLIDIADTDYFDDEDPFVNCQDITVELDASGNYALTLQSVLAPSTYNFTDATETSNTSGPWLDLKTADLNNDGHLDYMIVQQYNADQIFLGDGSGSFSLHQTIPTNQTNNSHAFDFRDLDGDSDLDIIHYNRHGTLRTFLNDGLANFTLNTSTSGSNARNGHSADVDGDGDLDAFITHEAFSKLMLNDGSNNFINSGQTFAPGNYDVRLIDLTGDGFPEIYAYDNASSSIVLYINDGTGVFTQSTQTFAASGEYQAGLADLDGDGDVDITVDGKVFFNDGSANFTDSGQTVPQEPILIDADGDGDMDIFGKMSGTSLFINDGSGNYTNSGYSGPGFGYKVGDVGDIDNDGDMDILLIWHSNFRFIRNDLIQSYGDNCDSNPVLTMDINSLSCINTESPVSVTVSIEDNSGNTANCMSIVTVEDNTAPVAICQDITVQLDSFGTVTISPNDVDNGSSDACGVASLTLDKTIFDCDNEGANTVILTIEDNNGNISTCAANVTVEDFTNPIAICQDLTIQLDGTGNANITAFDIDNGSNDACGIQGLAVDIDSFTCLDIGVNTVTLTVTDNNGNESICTSTVTVEDNVPPIAICQDITVQLDASGNASITTNDLDNGSNDACGIQSMTIDNDVFDCGDTGINNVVLTVTDNNGNVSICNSTVTIQDTESPSVTCPGNIEVNNDTTVCGAIVDFVATGEDNCGAIITYSQNPMTLFNVGTTTVIVTATDPSGNTTACTFDVTVTDNEIPVFVCPADITLDANIGACVASEFILETPDISDNCEIVSFTNDAQTSYPVGVNEVEYLLEDVNGNVSSCIQLVTVVDNQPPSVVCNDITIDLPNRNDYSLTQADIDAIGLGSSDNCTEVSFAITEGITTYNCDDKDQVFTVTLTATDPAGNQSNCTATVTIIDSQSVCNDPPMALCQDIILQTDENCEAYITVDQIDGGSTDPDGDDLTFTLDNYGPFGVGTYTVALYATDGEYVDSCTSTVIIEDITEPSVICQDLTIQLDENGEAYVGVLDIDNGSNDACGLLSLATDIKDFDCSMIGENTVILTAIDANGNSAFCTATITVEDNVAPMAICQDITIQLDASGSASITANDIDNGSSDACGIQSLALDITTFDCTDIGSEAGTVLDFDGINDVVNLTTSYGFQGNNTFTVEFMTKTTDDNGDFVQRGFAPSSYSGWGVNLRSGQIGFVLSKHWVSGNRIEVQTTTMVNDDNWHHIAVSYNGNLSWTGVKIYIDGVEQTLSNPGSNNDGITSSGIGYNSWPAMIGGHQFRPGTHFHLDGQMDEVRIWDVVKTIGEIQANMGGQLPGAEANLIGYWQMDDAPGSSIATAIVGPNGTLVNMDPANDWVSTGFAAPTVTLTVTDNNGNTSTCEATVTVEDNVAPVAICQDITVQLDASGSVSITATEIDNGSNDACGIASLSIDNDNFGCADVGANTVTLSVTDVNGNISNCTSTVTVQDNVAPIAICQDITIQLNSSGTVSISANDIDNGSNDACGIASLNIDMENFDCTHVGSNTLTLTVTDNNGNVSMCTSNVTIEDNVNPIALCQNITIQLDANGGASITAGDVDNGSNDACGIADLSIDVDAFTCSNVGANTVELTITDNNGNESTCNATVTVQDNVDPIAICQDITVQLETSGAAMITPEDVDNGSNDACGILSLTIDDESFGCADVGANTVTLTVIDNNSNVSTCTSTVTVEDNVYPTAICQDITIQLDASGAAMITPADVDNGSNDACGIESLTIDDDSFECGDIGANLVTLTVIDNNGNVSMCTSTVTVEDNVAPVAVCQDITVQLDATGIASIIANDVDGGSNDACGINNLSIDNDSFTCVNVGSNTVTLSVTDVNGNVSMCTSTVTVEDNVNPVIDVTGSDLTIECDGAGNAAELAAWLAANADAIATDACGITWSNDFATLSNDCGATGSATVIFTATDDNGNSVSTSATFTIEDNTTPDLTCPDDIAICADQGLVTGAVVTWAPVTSTDVCGTVTITSTHNSGDVFPIGTTTVTYTATDDCGNPTTCSFDVTVYELPEVSITEAEESIYCQGDYVILTANEYSNTGGITYAWSTGDDSQSIDVNTSDIYSVVVTDSNGCTREASYNVNVSQQNLLASYTILAEKEAHLHGDNEVLNGGVGVYNFGGKAKIHSNSMVTGPTTFVKADIIEVQNNSAVTVQISDPTNVGLPPFLNNNMSSNNDITVAQNTTVVLSDQVYGKVKIKKNTNVTFTQKDIFLKELDIDDDAVVNFTSCAFVRVSKKMKIDKDVTVNNTGAQVWFYVDDKVDIKEGALINASIYALGHDIKVKGKSNNPSYMNGLFIGRKVHGDKFVTWDWGTSCDPGCIAEEPIVEICESEGGSTMYEWIQKVKIGSINNNSGDNGGYADYRNLSTSIAAGSSKTITLTPGFSGSKYKEYWRVWVDWNQDGDFDDSGEKEVQKASKNPIYKSISVPNNAISGTTTMRVSMMYGGYADPCEDFVEGEVEDYSINVVNNIDEENGDIESRDITVAEEVEEQLPISLEVYPNPTRGMMKVEFENAKSETMNLIIIDSRGQTIRTNSYDINRTRSLDLDITELPSGLYQLVMNFGDEVISKKIIKVD